MDQNKDVKEIKNFAKCVVEANQAKLKKLGECGEPLDCYAQEIKMRWHRDVRSFSKNLIDGYRVLLEQLGRENQS
ncbi:MAG: hypothetical protein ACH350_05615 [Parachlamydiaceae bacterium]